MRVALPTQMQMHLVSCRLPLPDTPVETPQPSELVLLIEHLSAGPITTVQIKTMTRKDPILSRVYMYMLHGWAHITDDHIYLATVLFKTERIINSG